MRRALVAGTRSSWRAMAAGAGAETYQVSDLPTLTKLVAETLNPGDVVEIQPGTYYLEISRIPIERSGSPEAPIIIRGVMKDGKRPVIDAEKVNVMRERLRRAAGRA